MPGFTGAGFVAAAGCPRLADSTPVTAFGWAVAPTVGDAARVAEGDGEADAEGASGCGVAIGPAGAGFFCASSATVNSMAWSIGIRVTPLVLSIQA